MSLHHGLTDLCDNHFTDSFILAWFQASSQASLRFCLRAPLTSKQLSHTESYRADRADSSELCYPVRVCVDQKTPLQLASHRGLRAAFCDNKAMSVWKSAVDQCTASSLHARRCSLLHAANPVCSRPLTTKRALPCHERTPAWRRCCRRKTALRARKAAEDGDDAKVTTQFLALPTVVKNATL